MVKIKLVDPTKSLRIKLAGGGAPKGGPGNTKNHPKGHINNPLGIGGVPKGGKGRNPTAKGGIKKGSAESRARIMKAILVRTGRLDGSMSRKAKTEARKERVKEIALEARELQELAKKSMPAAMKRINKIITDERSQDHHAIAATVFLADRAYGKALQPSLNAGADNNGKPSEIDDIELNKRIAEALDRVARITGGEAKKAKGKK